jgi:hypothetical protein
MRSLTPALTPVLVHKSRAFTSALERMTTKLSPITPGILRHLERFGILKIGGGGGQGGIRTHGELAPSAVFKTAAFDHSATCPHSP